MKIGLLADIHGNSDALKVVIDSLAKDDCSNLVIAGDLVGYYYDTNEVLKLLNPFNITFVKGNHEEMLSKIICGDLDMDFVQQKYGSALQLCLQNLSKENLDFLISSPVNTNLKIDNLEINVSHGTPLSVDEYVYPDAKEEQLDIFSEFSAQVFILGNTHHQMIKHYKDKLIINPGSVGQSRTNKSTSQWAILETETLAVTFKSQKYDSSRIVRQSLEIDPNVPLLRKYF